MIIPRNKGTGARGSAKELITTDGDQLGISVPIALLRYDENIRIDLGGVKIPSVFYSLFTCPYR